MSRTAVDTSVLVAGVVEWHEEHAICRRERARLESAEREPSVPAHALLEAYSVLTRLPGGRRLRAVDALAVLEGAYGAWPLLPSPPDLWETLAAFAAREVIGGAVYDAVILESACAAGADELITLDLGDFQRLARGRIAVRRPGGE